MLKGKIAVVTGGSRGIGAAICRELAKNGASVALLYAGSDEKAAAVTEELISLGTAAKCYRCDVSDLNTVTAVFKTIASEFGPVDILINNAGVTADKLLMTMKEREFDKVLAVNLKGAFNTIKQVYPVFLRRRSGKIINIASVAGLSGNAGQVNYAASKAGLIALTKSVAKELASRGICCNAIAPGLIDTDMTAGLNEVSPIMGSIPLGRAGKPEEVAALAVFLASPLSDYITGEVIRIDGGLAM
ncbi:MAG: 3-oxoacyl-[acyl-carrier-protein] reductase [Clostridiales bacterium]|nr:3-oxoacyl-[acyl-carrier-protein] reductase [Clostridiales bacterium]